MIWTRRSFLLGAGTLVLVPAPVRAGDVRRLAGRWRYVGGQAQRARAAAAADWATEPMNVLVRGIVRSMLKTRIRSPSFTISITDTHIDIDHGVDHIRAPRVGKPVPWTNEHGDRSTVRHRVIRDRILQHIVNAQGDRQHVFVGNRAENSMTLYCTIRAARLPRDVDYRFSYRRVS